MLSLNVHNMKCFKSPMFMRSFLSAVLLVCAAILPLHAQRGDAMGKIIDAVNANRVSFSYTYSFGIETKMTGRGTAVVQGDCFILKGDGLEIYCDGKTAASIDREAKEMIYESVLDEGNYINPAHLILSVEKGFKVKSVTETNYAGIASLKYILEPTVRTNIVRMTMTVAKDGSALFSLSLSLNDGSSNDFSISSFRILPKLDVSEYKIDESKLDSSYIITDLRQ